ncbi:MAG: HIT family protein [Bacteroidia bacterium]
MASIFSKIIKGEIPSYKILEDENFYAFLDVFPLVEGHTLVVPKIEVDNIFDLDADTYAQLFKFAKQVESKLRKSIPCKRIGIAVIGLEVPHAHIHLVPLNHVDDINFSRTKMKPSKEELEAIQKRILS